MKHEISQRPNGSRRVVTHIEGESMTQQQFASSCDLKTIIKQRSALGIPLEIPNDPFDGSIQDFTGAGDYRTNLERLMRADQAFMALPAAVRKKFDNDPAELISFLEKEENFDEALKLGLLKEGAQPKGQNDDKTTNNSPKHEPPHQDPKKA